MGAEDDDRRARATLGWLCEPGDTGLRRLLARHAPRDVVDMLSRQEVPVVRRSEIRHLPTSRLWDEAAAAVEEAQRGGGRVVIPADPDWPPGLRGPDGGQPVCLWARGPAPIPPPAASVTIVGSRASSSYGNHVAADLAAGLATHGWTVVSSGGLGIDSAVLRAALAVGGRAVAVLPCGLDRLHPHQHRALLARLAETGLLLSVQPPGADPTLARMAAHRALLAALTAGTVVVEASARSAALQTVRQALDRGRAGLVVPGPVTSAVSAGCLELLRTDARVRAVGCAGHIVADLAPPPGGGPRGGDTGDGHT
ncbi:DNA processing protein DprA [Micromonospora noduli]|uniref:DNA-processing protein DprA n=1 Tax=Micromonospora noduli TaxID=709876 RepID=UPI000DC23A30|nr:DNA-processing protein DprA [Micromonospora noduli]KAB1918892.1 DNA processing protein DprA [Micromonospora noduli]RAO30121.1 Protein smf [Micromonospora noduli]